MKLQFIAFTLIYLLFHGVGGKQQILQKLDGPFNSLSIALRYSQSNFSNTAAEDENQRNEKATLPSLPCEYDSDCEVYDEPLICVHGQCDCMKPYCWVYRFESSGWGSRNIFSCGDCGQLGSWCNETLTCDTPGTCWSDGYCHCKLGENINGICVVVDQSWTLKVTLGGFGIIFLVALIVILYNCWRNRPWERPGWCWGACNKTGSTRGRRGSCEKTPAFTVQHLYAIQIAGTNDDTLQNSLEVYPSTSAQRTRFRAESDLEGLANSSLGSVETTTTDISEISLAGPAGEDDPPGASALPTEPSRSLPNHIEAANNFHEPSASHKNSAYNIIFESGCKHERCKLCLPKGLSTRPSSVSSLCEGASRSSTPTRNNDEPTIELINEAAAIKLTDTDIPESECTRF